MLRDGSTNPLRDVTIQVAAEAAVSPVIQWQHVTIKKKYAIVVFAPRLV